jgi:Ig-like domain-containing protein
MRTSNKLALIVVMLSIFLSACGLSATPAEPSPTPVDLNAYATKVVGEFVGQLTQTAAAWTSTPTLEPTATPTLGPTNTPEATATLAACNLVKYVADVSIPDNSVIAANTEFVKTWRVQNVGSCTWNANYKLVFSYHIGSTAVKAWETVVGTLANEVKPSETVDISITLKSPTDPGDYGAAWGMVTDKGIAFPKVVTLQITVPKP